MTFINLIGKIEFLANFRNVDDFMHRIHLFIYSFIFSSTSLPFEFCPLYHSVLYIIVNQLSLNSNFAMSSIQLEIQQNKD